MIVVKNPSVRVEQVVSETRTREAKGQVGKVGKLGGGKAPSARRGAIWGNLENAVSLQSNC